MKSSALLTNKTMYNPPMRRFEIQLADAQKELFFENTAKAGIGSSPF